MSMECGIRRVRGRVPRQPGANSPAPESSCALFERVYWSIGNRTFCSPQFRNCLPNRYAQQSIVLGRVKVSPPGVSDDISPAAEL